MDKLIQLLKRPTALGIAGLLIGLIFGLVVLGWGVWPVEWVDGAPKNLSADYQRNYLCMTIDSYIRNQDQNLMRLRWDSLGTGAMKLLSELKPEDCRFTSNAEIDNFKTLMNVPASSSLSTSTQTSAATSATSTTTKTNLLVQLLPVLMFFLLTVAAGATFFYLLKKKSKLPSFQSKNIDKDPLVEDQKGFIPPAESTEKDNILEKPMAQFMSSYRIGQDLYEESFSIDSATGEFLGECGIGIADTIGVGDPKKVTALEMWLFDKDDIQTATRVLMSEHAYDDQAIRARLLTKGEPVLLKPGQNFIMETSTLQLEAKVADLVYGRGPLPENSFFQRLTLEISVWQKIH